MFEAQDIHKIYKHLAKPLPVLKGISLTIKEGEVLAIVGPSGAGKSTFLHILGGLDKPSSGKVSLEGQDIYALNDNQRARIRNQRIGFIFQFYHLLPEFSALENVILPAMVFENLGQIDPLKSRGMQLLERVGLSQRAEHRPNQLSGGEQQRVAIARALVNDPKIILCDEPTGNLDSESGAAIIDLLIGLNEKYHKTIIIVTHDEKIAQRSHKVIHMRDGLLSNN